MKLRSRWLYAVPVTILGIALVYLLLDDEAPTIEPFPDELVDSPDLLIAGSRVRQFGPDGQVRYELSASSAIYAKDHQQADFEELHLLLKTEQEAIWFAQANAGTLREIDDMAIVDLNGEVELWTDPETTDKFILRSDGLRVFPETKQVVSTAPVVVMTPKSKIYAHKIKGDLNTREWSFSGTSDRQVELLYKSDS